MAYSLFCLNIVVLDFDIFKAYYTIIEIKVFSSIRNMWILMVGDKHPVDLSSNPSEGFCNSFYMGCHVEEYVGKLREHRK
jgi:hypothetical protein